MGADDGAAAPEAPANPFLASDGVATRVTIARLKSAGVDPAPLLAKAGLARPKRAGAPHRINAEGQLRFLELAAEALDDAAFGFHLAQATDLREIGILYYVAAASRDLGDAIRHLVRFTTVANESLRLERSQADADAVLALRSRLARRASRQFTELTMTALVRAFRALTGTRFSPTSVTFAHGRTAGKAEIERFFGCAVQFGAAVDAMAFPATRLATPILTADTYLLNILRAQCERTLAERGNASSSLRAMVESEAAALLPNGNAQVETVARALGMSARTLARRLADEKASYGGVLDDLRRDLALRHLKDGDLSLNQIAWLLGYSEVTSFNHAFKRWTGGSPKSARAAVNNANLDGFASARGAP